MGFVLRRVFHNAPLIPNACSVSVSSKPRRSSVGFEATARFQRNKAIGCYFGLIPKQDASGRSNRLGHITRDGPSVVRSLLVEAAWQGIRRCPQIREVYERIMRDDKQRKKIALVATAHYLIRAMLAMLQTGEVWRYSTRAA